MERSGKSTVYFVSGKNPTVSRFIPGTGTVNLSYEEAAEVQGLADFTCIQMPAKGGDGPTWLCYDSQADETILEGTKLSQERDSYIPLFIESLEALKGVKGLTIIVI